MKLTLHILLSLLMASILCTSCHDDNLIRAFQPGDELTEADLKEYGPASFFTVKPIPDSIFSFMQGRSYKVDSTCTITRDSLRYVTCLHYDINGRVFIGEMVVNAEIADKVCAIFRRLYTGFYPIERMRLIDHYEADDERSMEANNSSAFNYRLISHTNVVSKHGRGIAIDINPLYNPYYKVLGDGTEVIEPAIGEPYLDRTADYPYKIRKGDLCYRVFTENGFVWGGDWEDRKDYQHFELP